MSFLVDSDVLITAKNSYYAFDLCPGFWESLLALNGRGELYSLDRNRQELLQGRDDDELVKWVNETVPDSFFLSCSTSEITESYTEVILWVQRNPQYFDGAKAQFATGADGWLVAYARVHGSTVVTLELPRPEARNQIKIPDVSNAFGVAYQDPFAMLRVLQVQYHYENRD